MLQLQIAKSLTEYMAALGIIDSLKRLACSRALLSTPFLPALDGIYRQQRSYRRHTWDSLRHSSNPCGRSVAVNANKPTQAYFQLRDIIQESRLRELVRSQERFERNTDKRRRKRKEKEWRIYMRHVKKRVQIAFDLKNRTRVEKANYDEI